MIGYFVQNLKNFLSVLQYELCIYREIHCIIADCTSKVLKRAEVNSIFQRFVQTFYLNDVAFSNLPLISISDSLSEQIACSQSPTSFETVTSKGSVVIGGTYDHIHSGHKVLLSESILLAHKRLLIGTVYLYRDRIQLFRCI